MTLTTDTFDAENRPGSTRSPTAGLVTLYAPDVGVPSAILLVDEELVLGREPGREPADAGLVLPFSSVSRDHARLTLHEGQWRVEDLESRNGTFVNGAKIYAKVLANGDDLRVGEVVFRFVDRGAERFLDSGPDRDLPEGVAALVGGATMAGIRMEILRVARAELSVLVLGESGTGKELVARALHSASGRAGALVAVNCAAVPAALLEAELFGAKRGAFTGLDRDRLGLVRSADGGTLFLDEIGDMPLDAQAKLLRVLDTRQVTPLGSHIAEPVDIRIVSATHRPIVQLVEEQRFRADLFARISAHTIDLPPLRERKEDIARLVGSFLGAPATTRATSRFMIGLLRYDWPLNVRELASAVRRAVALAGAGGELDEPHLPGVVTEAIRAARAEDQSKAAKIPSRSNAPPAEELRALLQRHAGNVASVARALGKDRTQIHRWLKLYQMSTDDFRP
jgi:DNA-binding NtrC family response regulator